MKKGLLILLLVAGTGISTYCIYYHYATAPVMTMVTQLGGEMEWLRREYHLSDSQYVRIQAIHRDYALKCDLMCGKIGIANAHLDQLLLANKTYTPEVAAGMKECMSVQGECRQALLTHIYAVSAEMSPAAGARYITMMKARIIEPAVGREVVTSESSK